MNATTPEAIGRILLWLEKLGQLTRAGTEPIPDAEGMATYAAMLGRTLPVSAFTSESLHAIADENRFFPAFADLRAKLQTWWNVNKPVSAPRLEGPASHLAETDRQWLDFWHRRRAEILAPGYTPKWANVQADLDNLASLIRDKSIAAWAVISGEAERGRPMMTEAQRVEMADKLAALVRELRVNSGRPGRPNNDLPAEPDVPPPPKPQHLEGDALRAFRARCGNPVPVPGPTPAAEHWSAPEPSRAVGRAPEPDPEPEPLSRAFPPAMQPAGDDDLDELLPEGAL